MYSKEGIHSKNGNLKDSVESKNVFKLNFDIMEEGGSDNPLKAKARAVKLAIKLPDDSKLHGSVFEGDAQVRINKINHREMQIGLTDWKWHPSYKR